jgi:DNA-binding MarR family transcriptional regulator
MASATLRALDGLTVLAGRVRQGFDRLAVDHQDEMAADDDASHHRTFHLLRKRFPRTKPEAPLLVKRLPRKVESAPTTCVEDSVLDTTDAVDGMRDRLAALYPELDTRAFGVTGRVLRLAQAIDRLRAAHLSQFGLVPGDFDVLATIRRIEGERGVNPGRLLQSVLITSGGLTKRLDRLQAAGWMVRQPDPSDRRGTLVRLTPEGRDLIDRALASLLTREQELIERTLSGRQRDQTAANLRRLVLALPAD